MMLSAKDLNNKVKEITHQLTMYDVFPAPMSQVTLLRSYTIACGEDDTLLIEKDFNVGAFLMSLLPIHLQYIDWNSLKFEYYESVLSKLGQFDSISCINGKKMNNNDNSKVMPSFQWNSLQIQKMEQKDGEMDMNNFKLKISVNPIAFHPFVCIFECCVSYKRQLIAIITKTTQYLIYYNKKHNINLFKLKLNISKPSSNINNNSKRIQLTMNQMIGNKNNANKTKTKPKQTSLKVIDSNINDPLKEQKEQLLSFLKVNDSVMTEFILSNFVLLKNPLEWKSFCQILVEFELSNHFQLFEWQFSNTNSNNNNIGMNNVCFIDCKDKECLFERIMKELVQNNRYKHSDKMRLMHSLNHELVCAIENDRFVSSSYNIYNNINNTHNLNDFDQNRYQLISILMQHNNVKSCQHLVSLILKQKPLLVIDQLSSLPHQICSQLLTIYASKNNSNNNNNNVNNSSNISNINSNANRPHPVYILVVSWMIFKQVSDTILTKQMIIEFIQKSFGCLGNVLNYMLQMSGINYNGLKSNANGQNFTQKQQQNWKLLIKHKIFVLIEAVSMLLEKQEYNEYFSHFSSILAINKVTQQQQTGQVQYFCSKMFAMIWIESKKKALLELFIKANQSLRNAVTKDAFLSNYEKNCQLVGQIMDILFYLMCSLTNMMKKADLGKLELVTIMIDMKCCLLSHFPILYCLRQYIKLDAHILKLRRNSNINNNNNNKKKIVLQLILQKDEESGQSHIDVLIALFNVLSQLWIARIKNIDDDDCIQPSQSITPSFVSIVVLFLFVLGSLNYIDAVSSV